MNYENFKRNGTAIIDMVTYDMKEAVHGTNHILVSAQAQGFEDIFEELAPLLEDGQTVSIFPDNFGSLILRRIMREKGIKTNVIIAGYSSLVYGARLTEFNDMETETDVVNVMYRENEIRVDTLPSSDFELYNAIKNEIPALDATTLVHGDTALDIGLSNLNPLLHVPAVVLNIGTIENWGHLPYVGDSDVCYDIYAHGASAAVGRIQYAFHMDSTAIANAYGVGVCEIDPTTLSESRMGLIGEMFYGAGYRHPFDEPLDLTTWLPAPKGTRFTFSSRYITEDVPVACCAYNSFAKVLGVQTPIHHAMTTLAGIAAQTDFDKTGFTLKNFGLDGMTPDQMVKYMRTGKL